MKKSILSVLLGVLLIFTLSAVASATLIDDTVVFTHNTKVGSSIVFENASEWSLASYYTVDVGADDIVITFNNTPELLTPSFLTVSSLNDSSGLLLSGIKSDWANTSFGTDSVTFDLSGLSFAYGFSITAELTFGGIEETNSPATMHNPIPAPILLLGTGLVGLAGFRRRIKK